MRGTRAKRERKLGLRSTSAKQPHNPDSPLHTACLQCGRRTMVSRDRLCAKCVTKNEKKNAELQD